MIVDHDIVRFRADYCLSVLVDSKSLVWCRRDVVDRVSSPVVTGRVDVQRDRVKASDELNTLVLITIGAVSATIWFIWICASATVPCALIVAVGNRRNAAV